MKTDELKSYYQEKKIDPAEMEIALRCLKALEEYLIKQPVIIKEEEISTKVLDDFIETLFSQKRTSIPVFHGLMRYFRMMGRNDLFVHLAKYTGPEGVIDTILSRAKEHLSQERMEKILKSLDVPVLGTNPSEYPKFTADFIKRMKRHCSSEELIRVMAGNNHQIPEAAFFEEKALYDKAPTLEAYLKGLHERQVAILQKYSDEKKVWYEQIITQEVVDFVKNDQEIQSAVLKDGKLYTKKIPYDPVQFLQEMDGKMKRYYACHCPFARESILSGSPKIDPDWCLCSAGFSKFEFEVILGHELPIKCLANALEKDQFCRFEIDLAGIPYKK